MTPDLEAENKKLRRALEHIQNYEHYSEACNCYYGDNGYCCGSLIAEQALRIDK